MRNTLEVSNPWTWRGCPQGYNVRMCADVLAFLRSGFDVTVTPVAGREPWNHVKAAA